MSATDAMTDLSQAIRRLEEVIAVTSDLRRKRALERAHLRALQARADVIETLMPHEIEACRVKGQIPEPI